MENTAIYVQKTGTDADPLSRIGICPIQSAPSGPDVVFVVESPDAERIYSLVGSMIHPFLQMPSSGPIECRMPPDDASAHVLAACGVDIIGVPPFRYRVVSDRRATCFP